MLELKLARAKLTYLLLELDLGLARLIVMIVTKERSYNYVEKNSILNIRHAI